MLQTQKHFRRGRGRRCHKHVGVACITTRKSGSGKMSLRRPVRMLQGGGTILTQILRSVSSVAAQRPRRSLLFVPGNDVRKVNKAATLDADCIALDCEDGVAMNRKDEARENISQTLGKLDFGQSELAVRINCIDSGLASDDLAAVLSSKVLPDCLLIPKVENVSQVKWLSNEVGKYMGKRKEQLKLPTIMMIENAIGLLNMREVFEEGIKTSHPFHIQAGVIGTDDFLASIGGARTADAKELIFARQYLVTHCKAYGLQAIDMVHIDFKDLESLQRSAEEGAKMGFTGKQIIHPGQIEIVNQAFLPSPEKLEWAEALITSFEQHQKHGKGAFTFRGSMIDMPSLKQAKNLVLMIQSVRGRQ